MTTESLHPVQFKRTYEGQYGSARVSQDGYISDLHVQEQHRKEGHGSAIMGQITSDADKFGHALTMHARPDLHKFYEKHGFIHTGYDYMGPKKVPRLERKPKDIKGI